MAHDARNMVTALGLYCDLLEEPGVLATPFTHYGHELRLVAAASRRLVEKLVAIDAQREPPDAAGVGNRPSTPATGTCGLASLAAQQESESRRRRRPRPGVPAATCPAARNAANRRRRHASASRRWDLLPAVPVANLAAELLANRNLLAALAGPAIALTVDAEGGARPVRLTGEDLTRMLVNLVKNAAEAMPRAGASTSACARSLPRRAPRPALLLTIEDNGPGIPQDALETIFASGYTSHGMARRLARQLAAQPSRPGPGHHPLHRRRRRGTHHRRQPRARRSALRDRAAGAQSKLTS